MNITSIFLRKETLINEYRTPLIPSDIKILIDNGYKVYVQRSHNRCIKDKEFEKVGAFLVNDEWYNYKDCLIIGIKELNNLDLLNNHTHIYFSHSYKNQINSDLILNAFKNTNSKLYDLEYFLDNSKRMISFSFFAGIVGSILGITQYYLKKNFKNNLYNLSLNNSYLDLVFGLINYFKIRTNINIGLIGPNGKSGKGVDYILKFLSNVLPLKIKYYFKNTPKNDLLENDILINCINLKENIGTWFDSNTEFKKYLLIVDISCDYTNQNNPIKIYSNKTTWENPIYQYNNYVDIIAIENLPSLIPYDSSIYFSGKLTNLLLELKNGDKNNYWKNNLDIFYEKILNSL